MTYRVRNWRSFQHYNGRRPPWIKLHHDLLDNYEFLSLPLASRALAPLIWLLASESDDGTLPSDVTKLAFRLRCSESELQPALKALVDHGFLEHASNALAECKQSAMPEAEAEAEAEAEEKQRQRQTSLERFTAAFNASYKRRIKPPALNRGQEAQLKALVRAHGESGACCLPLLAWCYDQQQGGEERLRTRAVSHLLRDGQRSFAWASLLERAETLLRPEWQHSRRVWALAKELWLEDALAGFGCRRPEVVAPAVVAAEPISPERLAAAKAEGVARWIGEAKARAGVA